MEEGCQSQALAFAELDKVAPEVPLLALGQTIFWDEPMKAGVALASHKLSKNRTFVAGIHDTDYFAKAPQGVNVKGFAALEHNDTTTKTLWSAAAEFSRLFGSETVITKDTLVKNGASLSRLQRGRPGLMDEITTAWGWKGLVDGSEENQIVAHVPMARLGVPLFETLEWAVSETLSNIAGANSSQSKEKANQLLSTVCNAMNGTDGTLSDFYERVVQDIYSFVAHQKVELDVSRTTELLRFNNETCNSPRFELVSHFFNLDTAEACKQAYNEAVRGSEIYGLERFGTGALPFDLVIPGIGRGTLRIGNRGLVVMTQKPVAVSYKVRPKSLADLAEIIESKWGPNCSLIGKAVTLIGMLSKEYVFVFHTGASGYVTYVKRLLSSLKKAGIAQGWHPILRVDYRPWEALQHSEAWFNLPEELARAFGTQDLSGQGFASRLETVVAGQQKLLNKLQEIRRPLELVDFLREHQGQAWECRSQQYAQVQEQLHEVESQITQMQSEKRKTFESTKHIRKHIDDAQKELGEHWRERIFEKEPSPQDHEDRLNLQIRLAQLRDELKKTWTVWREQQAHLDAFTDSAEVKQWRKQRDDIAFEAELARVRLIREAIIITEGLKKAGNRPSAWWFPLVCPSGKWFDATTQMSSYQVEALA